MRIVLTGFMGSGKSTVGKLLADKLSLEFVDLDKLIEKREEKSVSSIFTNEGENIFRKKERKYLEEVLKKNNIVIATGGGTPCFYNNLELINKNSFSIYLKVGVDKLYQRLSKKNVQSKRPLLKNYSSAELLKFIRKKLKERENFYMKVNLVIRVGERSKKALATEIKSKILNLR